MFGSLDEVLEFVKANNHTEGRSYEYKKGLPWDNNNKDFQYKLIKAILSISNLRDGGYIIIGVEKNDYGKYETMGMDDYCVGTMNRKKF